MNIRDRHFNLNRILLLAIGLWPYQKSKLVRFQFICFFSILISFIIFQFTTFWTSKCTKDLTIQVLSALFCFIGATIWYKLFWYKGRVVKSLMEQLQQICDNLEDNEMAIIEKYSNSGKYYTITFTMIYVCCGIIVLCAQFWPDFLDIISPKNESRSHRLLFITEYFLDQERYFYLLLLHLFAATNIAIISCISISTIIIAYLKHACGMFKITSYRIEHTMNIYVLHNINQQKDKLLYEGLICAIDIHRKAIRFVEYITSSFEISLLFEILLIVITLSLNIFRVFQIASSAFNIQEFIMSSTIGFLCIAFLFVGNFIGQEIIDHYNHVFITVYQVDWYAAPVHVQKLLLFMLRRGTKAFSLNMCGLLTASLQSFSSLINTSISYTTVIYSVTTL